MTTSIWPRTDGDVILDLRLFLRDGVMIPMLVAVDKTGASIAEIIEVRDGGGHVEMFRVPLAASVGFDLNSGGKVLIHPESV